jgi:hypothetical protein
VYHFFQRLTMNRANEIPVATTVTINTIIVKTKSPTQLMAMTLAALFINNFVALFADLKYDCPWIAARTCR